MKNENKSGKHKARFYMPPNALRNKVGYGGIPKDRLKNAQRVIENNKINFVPYARGFLEEIDHILSALDSGETTSEKARADMVQPVMELKANGAMFHYDLISELAAVALNFLEAIDTLDEDALAVIGSHQRAGWLIVKNRLKGDGGEEGYRLSRELFEACQRYYRKHKTAG